MTPNMLRQLWSLVESSHPKHLLELDDCSLVTWLINQMKQRDLSAEQNRQDAAMETYIREHLLLIRDIADDSWQHQHRQEPAISC